ncbi:MAG: GFA family protein [Proteobacteria bacterium]|nr:GFA family protein [Pseudomonadota bacterium]
MIFSAGLENDLFGGGCHCGRVSYEVEAPDAPEVIQCNCSICTQSGFLHLIVPVSDFRLLSGSDELTTYTFGTHTARHCFCRVCGLKSFYYPRSHPGCISVNVHCLRQNGIKLAQVRQFDGRHWEQSIVSLRDDGEET